MLLILRLTVLIGLAILLAWPPLGRVDAAEGVTSAGPVVRRSTEPPTLAELDSLAGLGVPIFAALPTRSATAEVMLPHSIRVDRAAAIGWRAVGVAGEGVDVVLNDESGPIDSVTITLDEAGGASGAFRVRPAREGWHTWSVGSGHATGWVLPARKLRVLLDVGTASVEGREVARALEASGAELTVLQDLGRGLTPGGVPASIPTAPEVLASYDAIVLLGDASPTAAEGRAVVRFVESGGGVAIAGHAALASVAEAGLGIASASAAESADSPTTRGDSILWSLPAEIPPLPAADLNVATSPITPLGVGTASATTSARALLILGAVGRGRVAALGLQETWRWGLEAGRGDALADFWQGMVEWLAGGARADFAVDVDPQEGVPGVPVRVTLSRLAEDAVPPLNVQLLHPDSSREDLRVSWTGSEAVGVATFVPSELGTTEILLDGESVTAHLAAQRDSARLPSAEAWSRLALVASNSGGAALAADQLEARLGDLGSGGERKIPWTLWLAALLLLAGTEWGIRRFRGMP